MNLPAKYYRQADAVISARLQELESAVIGGFHQIRDGITTSMTALATIRDTRAWAEETGPNGRPIHSTFDSYLEAFVARLKEVDERIDISFGKVQEYLRFHARFVRGLGMEAEAIFGASPQALRLLESAVAFNRDGTIRSLPDGLNAAAIPGGLEPTELPEQVVKRIADAVVNAQSAHEAVGLVKAIRNEPEIVFTTGFGREIGLTVVRYNQDKPYVTTYVWDDKWPSEATEEFFRRLKVRDD